METFVIAIAALLASLLTFFSGFGLGTLLLAVMSLFFPVEAAVALTAVVHFSNNLFKLGLIGKYANKKIVLLFGLPAIAAAVGGAFLLKRLTKLEPLFTYQLGGKEFAVEPVALVIGLLIVAFAILDELPLWKNAKIGKKHLIGGGLLSGFFGGLSGHQGALRSMFFIHANLTKEAFIATGTLIAIFIDAARLPVYFSAGFDAIRENFTTLLIAVVAAFIGALAGRFLLKKVTLTFVQRVVMVMLILLGLGIAVGVV